MDKITNWVKVDEYSANGITCTEYVDEETRLILKQVYNDGYVEISQLEEPVNF